MVRAEGEEVDQGLRAVLTKKGQVRSKAVTITHSEKDGSCLLIVKPQEEGEHLLTVTFCGQHISNSPFSLPVNNRDYYRTTFKQPVKTIDMYGLDIAFSSNGDMFVTSFVPDSVHVYDMHGEKKKEIGKPGNGKLEFNSVSGIAINGDVVK